MSNEFFNKFLKELLPSILKYLEREFKLGKTLELDLGMMKIYVSWSEFSINEISYDITKTGVDLFAANNSLGFHIGNSNVNLTANYSLYVDPPILEDEGILKVGYNNLSIDIIFGMGPRKDDAKKLYVNLTESIFTLDPKNVYLKLNNTNDFDQLLITIVNTVQNSVIRLVTTLLTDYLQSIVDLVLGLIRSPITIDDISIDMSFYELPKVTEDGYVSAPWIAEVHPKGQTLPFENKSMLPRYDTKGKGLQTYISDFTLKSILYTLNLKGLLKVSITQADSFVLNTSYLIGLFPQLATKYGLGRPCRLDMWSDTTIVPDLVINEEGINIELFAFMRLGVLPKDQTEYDTAFEFKVDTGVVACLDINKNLTITMHIDKLQFNVTEIVIDNIGGIDIAKLNSMMTALLKMIQQFINILFQDGIDLSSFLPIPIYLKDIVVAPFTGYYMFQANPYFVEFGAILDMIKLLFENKGLLTSQQLFSKEILMQGLKKGYRAAEQVFNKDDHLYRPGMTGIRTAYNAFNAFWIVDPRIWSYEDDKN